MCDYFDYLGPLVEDGGGAWVGMSPIEHVEWSRGCPHPSEDIELAMKHLPEGFLDPVHFENEHTVEKIDVFRKGVMEQYQQFAADHEEE